MKRNRFSEAQIIGILKENEAGVSVPNLARKHVVGESTIYAWKSKYAGMSVSDLKRLKNLEKENRRLKQMYATLSMDHELLKEIIEKKYYLDVSEDD